MNPLLLFALLSPAAALSTTDTVRFTCHDSVQVRPEALNGQFTLRTTFASGEAMETAIHTITLRDTTIGGLAALVFDGTWLHTSGRKAIEFVVFCRMGAQPLALAYSGRLGTIKEEFHDRTVIRRSSNQPTSTDTLPAAAFPYTAFHVVALLVAAAGEGESFVPLYRDEETSRESRFQWGRAETRNIAGASGPLREVVITAFGGSTHFFFEPSPLRLMSVQLPLASGDMIEEIRR